MKFLKNNIYLIIFNTVNLVLISYLFYNYNNINNNNEHVSTLVNTNNKNTIYLTKITELQSKNSSSFTHYNNFMDDYIFDSPTEALILREFFQNKGIELPEYEIKQEKKPLMEIEGNSIHYLQFMYRFNDIKFKDGVSIIEHISTNNKYDFLNNISINRKNNNSISMSFIYSNMGILVD